MQQISRRTLAGGLAINPCVIIMMSDLSGAETLTFLTTVHTAGDGKVISGWDEGLLDMCLNEKRVLTIPSRKAFGTFAPAKRNYIPHLIRI